MSCDCDAYVTQSSGRASLSCIYENDGMIMIAFLHPEYSSPVMAKPFFLIIYRKDLLLFLESCIFADENN